MKPSKIEPNETAPRGNFVNDFGGVSLGFVRILGGISLGNFGPLAVCLLGGLSQSLFFALARGFWVGSRFDLTL